MGKFSSLTDDELTNRVIGIALDLHSQLGPGLLENAYKKAFSLKLIKEGFDIEVEKVMPLFIDGIKVEVAYKIDILVENKLVLELKSVEKITDVHLAQTINYLSLGNFRLGLILNFNVTRLKFGIQRVINKHFRES